MNIFLFLKGHIYLSLIGIKTTGRDRVMTQYRIEYTWSDRDFHV